MIPVRVFKLDGGGYLTIPARTPHRITAILEPQGAVVEELLAIKVRHTSELAEAAHHVAREVTELARRAGVDIELQVERARLEAHWTANAEKARKKGKRS